jgi:hypothetical protein
MKYKILIAIVMTAVMVSSVMAMVPLASGNPVNSPAHSGGMSVSTSLNGSINSHFSHMHNYGARLVYNTTNGNITGQYLIANFDSTTGVFSNITYNLTSTELISKMYATGNSKMSFLSSKLLSRPSSFTIGNMFIHMNQTSFFVLHNNPALESNIMVRGDLYMYVPSNAIIYNTNNNSQVTASANTSMNTQINTSATNLSFADNVMVNFNNTVNAGRQMIMIDNNGTVAMIFIHNGEFTKKGHEIIVKSYVSGAPVLVNIVVPPGLQKMPNNTEIMHGIMNGKISSEIALNLVNGTIANSTINYNSSIHFVYTGKTTSTTSFDINSSVNHHTIVTVFIGNHAMKNTGHAYVKFDGKIATYVSMSALVNETSTTHAYYSYTNTSSGIYVFMYVPHFSNHTMVVSNVPFQHSYTEYYIIGGIIAVIAIVGVAAYAIKKRK